MAVYDILEKLGYYKFFFLSIALSIIFMSAGFTVGQKNSNQLEQGTASFDNATDSGKALIVFGSVFTTFASVLILLFFYKNIMLERNNSKYVADYGYQFTGI